MRSEAEYRQDRALSFAGNFPDLCVCSLSVGSVEQLCWKPGELEGDVGGVALYAKPLTDLPKHPSSGHHSACFCPGSGAVF